MWKKIGIGVLALLILAAVGTLIFKLTKTADDGYEELDLKYEIGSIDVEGSYKDSESSLYTPEAINPYGLKCSLKYEKKISYQLFFYTGKDEFLVSTAVLTGAYDHETDCPTLAKNAEGVRIVIYPKVAEDETVKINIWNKRSFTKELTVLIFADQENKVIDFEYEVNKKANEVTLTKFINTTAKDVVIPESVNVNGKSLPVTEIGTECFYENTVIENVELPSTIRVLGYRAFGKCSNLKTLKLNEGLTVIGKSSISDCTSLEEIVIPSTVYEIGAWAFSDNTALKSINLPNSLFSIRSNAFDGCTVLDLIIIPVSVKEIDNSAFNNVPKLFIKCEYVLAEGEAKPASWNSQWYTGSNEVVWGYGQAN